MKTRSVVTTVVAASLPLIPSVVAAQAADNEPVHSGVDPRLQAQNPRVEVFMLNELARERAGTPEERQQRFSAEGAP